MEKKLINEINETYDLEIDRIVKEIKKNKVKLVLLQFPEGLKPYSTTIADEIENRIKKQGKETEIMIWMGSCFGACDVPLEVEKLGVDLIIQFGHTGWNFNQ